jgi:seryl-tRNA(Sec) selenium transferase
MAAAADGKARQAFLSAIDTGSSVAINAILIKFGMEARKMALIGVLKSLNFDNLSDAEKADLKKKLQAHKKELKDAASVVDRHLKKLSAKKKRKVAKRKTAKP